MRNIFQPDLFVTPVVEQRAPLVRGLVFDYAGRKLRIHRTYGTDARAPVIVEELGEFGTTLKGQYSLWSYDSVARAVRASTQSPAQMLADYLSRKKGTP